MSCPTPSRTAPLNNVCAGSRKVTKPATSVRATPLASAICERQLPLFPHHKFSPFSHHKFPRVRTQGKPKSTNGSWWIASTTTYTHSHYTFRIPPTAVGGLLQLLPTHTPATPFESHQRQSVDCFNYYLHTLPLHHSNPTNGSWWIASTTTYTHARYTIRIPPTAVGGLLQLLPTHTPTKPFESHQRQLVDCFNYYLHTLPLHHSNPTNGSWWIASTTTYTHSH